MRYLVVTWAILVLLVLAIHLIVGERNDLVGENPSVSSDGVGCIYCPGPPVGVVVDATPTPVASSITMPPLPSPAAVPVEEPTSEGAAEETLPPGSAPSSTQLDERQELANLVHATFPDDPHMGNSVVWDESLFSEVSWRGYVYGGVMSATGDCGLMQINWSTHAQKFAVRGWTQQDCFDPAKNLVIAREIYDTSGPWAWTTY